MSINPFRAKISKQPSSYPSTLFHLIRIGQFVSATIVLSILSFFAHFLIAERFHVPWTFLLLLVVSALTILGLMVTSIRHHLRMLSPTVNLVFNGISLILWALGFALLIWNVRSTLGNRCTRATWYSEGGIMICRLYKALATFTTTGLISTALSFLLDLRSRRLSSHQGIYNSMEDRKISLPDDTRHASSPSHQDFYSARSLSHEISRPYSVQRPIEAQQFGYTMPSEQTRYDGPSGSHWL